MLNFLIVVIEQLWALYYGRNKLFACQDSFVHHGNLER